MWAVDIGDLSPVSCEVTAETDIGFLAIGSADADHFHPGMSIDFLTRLGDLIAGALKRY